MKNMSATRHGETMERGVVGEASKLHMQATDSEKDSREPSVASLPTGSKRKNRSDTYELPQNMADLNRAERKKHREKKRRSEVNRGFDELAELLVQVDPQVRAEMERQWSTDGTTEENHMSRVRVIDRAVGVIRRLHQENEMGKSLIQELSLQVAQQKASVWSEVRLEESTAEDTPHGPSTLSHQYDLHPLTYLFFTAGPSPSTSSPTHGDGPGRIWSQSVHVVRKRALATEQLARVPRARQRSSSWSWPAVADLCGARPAQHSSAAASSPGAGRTYRFPEKVQQE